MISANTFDWLHKWWNWFRNNCQICSILLETVFVTHVGNDCTTHQNGHHHVCDVNEQSTECETHSDGEEGKVAIFPRRLGHLDSRSQQRPIGRRQHDLRTGTGEELLSDRRDFTIHSTYSNTKHNWSAWCC